MTEDWDSHYEFQVWHEAESGGPGERSDAPWRMRGLPLGLAEELQEALSCEATFVGEVRPDCPGNGARHRGDEEGVRRSHATHFVHNRARIVNMFEYILAQSTRKGLRGEREVVCIRDDEKTMPKLWWQVVVDVHHDPAI